MTQSEPVARCTADGKRDRRGRSYKPSTIRGLESNLRLHVLPLIGGMPVAALRRGDVRRMVDELATERGPTVANAARNALRRALALQVDREVVEVNVAVGARAPAPECRGARFLSLSEADRLQAAADADRYAPIGPMVALALASGLRESELLALAWGPDGLDLDARVVRVVRARDRRGATIETKSRRPRVVPVGAEAVARLRRWRLATGRPPDGAPVFRARCFDPWARVRAAAGLPDPQPRFHDLRHTAATHWLAAGLRSDVVAELLGHTDAGLVDRLYGHVLPEDLARAGDALKAWQADRRGR